MIKVKLFPSTIVPMRTTRRFTGKRDRTCSVRARDRTSIAIIIDYNKVAHLELDPRGSLKESPARASTAFQARISPLTAIV